MVSAVLRRRAEKMSTKIDVVCLAKVETTGRIHPVTFIFVRDDGGKPKEEGDQVEARQAGFHPNGFPEPRAALRWLETCGVTATYEAPGLNVKMLSSIPGIYYFTMQELRPFVPRR
jgi:hypothetical protein